MTRFRSGGSPTALSPRSRMAIDIPRRRSSSATSPSCASSARTASAPSRCRRAGSSTGPPSTTSASSSGSRGRSTSASSTRRRSRDTVRRAVADAVEACRDHPALFAFLVGNEIPPDIVRWYGARAGHRVPPRAGRRGEAARAHRAGQLRQLPVDRVPRRPTSSTSSPSTSTCTARPSSAATSRACRTSPATSRSCSPSSASTRSARGEDVQAATLSWQVRAAFESGAAGTFVFSWTDDWFTGGFADRGLGLRPGRPRAAHEAGLPRRAAQYGAPVLPPLAEYPKVSVVVCAYNAERTMDACLESLRNLHYPDYEVVVVNDGSDGPHRRHRGQLRGHPRHPPGEQGAQRRAQRRHRGGDRRDRRLHRLGLRGRSGLAALPRLHVRAQRLRRGRRAEPPAAGGLEPGAGVRGRVAGRADARAARTTRSPSTSPAATWRSPRRRCDEIGGFDPIFTAAGDDVDFCWRLQNRGYAIGFSPAAIVWHYRRNTVKAYLEAADGLRQGGGAALLQASVPLQHARASRAGSGASTASSRRPLLRAGRSSTSARSGAGSSRRCTSRRRRCSPTCRSRSSGTLIGVLLLA